MRVLIFGAGAVGSLFGALLARSGIAVELVGPAAHIAAIRREGLQVEGSVNGSWPVTADERIASPVTADLVIVAVKTFDLERAARTMRGALPSAPPVLLPQNGLGIEGRFERGMDLDPHRPIHPPLVRAINTVPATLLGPGRVRYAGSGEVRLADPQGDGPVAQATRAFYSVFERAQIPVRYVPDFDRALWTKAVVNAAINPVTAAFSVPNGALLEPPYRAMVESLAAEGIAAAVASGHPLSSPAVLEELWGTVRATAENRSSMLQDVERGRPTELEAINGALLIAGTAHGVPMPETERAIERVRSRLRTPRQP